MSKQTPENERASEMIYERFRQPPDLVRQRAIVAARVGEMSHEELKRAAVDLQIDTQGAKNTQDLAAVIANAARPITPE